MNRVNLMDGEIRCPGCGASINKHVDVCPHCGRKLVVGVFGFLVYLVLFIFFVSIAACTLIPNVFG